MFWLRREQGKTGHSTSSHNDCIVVKAKWLPLRNPGVLDLSTYCKTFKGVRPEKFYRWPKSLQCLWILEMEKLIPNRCRRRQDGCSSRTQKQTTFSEWEPPWSLLIGLKDFVMKSPYTCIFWALACLKGARTVFGKSLQLLPLTEIQNGEDDWTSYLPTAAVLMIFR